MDFFEFTFKEGDTFEHKFKSVEKYVGNNIKNKIKLSWKPTVVIQIFKERRTVSLEKDLYDLNKIYNQTLLVKIFGGATLFNHVSLNLEYLSDDQHWKVTSVNHDPLEGWRNLS
ncbi:hypothetical protein [Bacillus sp. ISL-55]|uniref:hypothetical protein n=1 Tax=Bacillus sp. ISL-55 TaxID=2819134 RepID=UPI001BE51478|nr:hypothetical protein [Bacillus sp. ISL-55]MBT2693534.1 hypothetical protein [Bacillus sp. ISL-55]